MRSLPVLFLTFLLERLRRRAAGWSDVALARLLGLASCFLRDPVLRRGASEVAGILRDGPPGSLVLRRMIVETTNLELREMVHSALRMRSLALPLPPTPSPTRVLLRGGSEGDAWLWSRAWRELLGAEAVALSHRDPELARSRAARWGLHSRADGEEVRSGEPGCVLHLLDDDEPFAIRALRTGQAVVLEASVEPTPSMRAAARNRGATLCVAEPELHGPAARRLLELLDRTLLGRPSQLLLETRLGGPGAWDPDLCPGFRPEESVAEPEADTLAFRELSRRLALAIRLLGPVSEIVCMGRLTEGASSLQVSWRHASERRQGVFRLVRAPGLRLRSAEAAREDLLEITGGAGVAWLSLGPARTRTTAGLRLYLQDELRSPECLDESPHAARLACAREIVGTVARGRSDPATLARVLEARRLARLALATPGERVRVASGKDSKG